jgi:hypothetical protein
MYMRLVSLFVVCASAFAASPVASTRFKGGDQGRIQVDVKVNGQGPFSFLFDTGSMNVISLDLAKQLGVKVGGQRTGEGFGGAFETASAVIDSISLGDLTMGRSEGTVIGGGPFSRGGLSGILGREVLAKLVAEVDYEHGRLRFFDPDGFAYAGHGTRLPLTAHENGLITIPERVFGVNVDIQVDSGSSYPLVLFPRFVQGHDLHAELTAITGYGFGGLTHAMVTRAPALEIGQLGIKNPIVYLSTDNNGIESGSADGNMGGPLLREFTATFDLPHQSLYLEPNEWYGKPELADKSGMVLDTRGKSVKVLFVYPHSPAAKAGIVQGDVVNDPSGQTLTGDQWHDLLDGPTGSIVRVTVNHQGRVASVSLALRPYL